MDESVNVESSVSVNICKKYAKWDVRGRMEYVNNVK